MQPQQPARGDVTSTSQTKKWDEERLAQSRLANLAKAREAQRAKKLASEEGFTLSPVPSAQEKPETVPQSINDAATVAEPQQSNNDTSFFGRIFFTLVTLLVPVALNALFEHSAVYINRHFAPREPATHDLPTPDETGKIGRWQGQSIFRQ
jgi:hypothetical protein